jgi:hypothetical protein
VATARSARPGPAAISWYLTSIQAGFEPWRGGVGPAVTDFAVITGGGGMTSATGATALNG